MVADFGIPGTGILHRLDPRAKLAGMLAILPVFFLARSPWLPLLYAAAMALLVVLAVGPRELGRALATIAPLLAVVLVLTPLFRRGGQPVVSIAGLTIVTTVGIGETARIAGRLLGLTLAFYAAVRTTPAPQFVLALRWYGLPFPAALSVSLAFRLIPTLLSLYGAVQEAHSLRRSYDPSRRLFARVVPVMTSVFVQSVRMIPSLAMALECRGFGRAGKRSAWEHLPPPAHAAVSFCITAVFVGAAYLPLAV
jgi:energy-coupling factor transport system permease protein